MLRDTSHIIDFNNIKILDKCNNVTSRKYLEACHTLKNNLTFNRALDISEIYHPLIRQ